MRALKFRAYDKKRKKWIMKDFHIIGETTVFNMLADYQLEEFENIEIMQWTGLKDKVGNKIFEGDIIESIRKGITYRNIVKYINGCFKYVKTYEKERGGCLCRDEGNYAKEITVIGNVHQNPELLETNHEKD